MIVTSNYLYTPHPITFQDGDINPCFGEERWKPLEKKLWRVEAVMEKRNPQQLYARGSGAEGKGYSREAKYENFRYSNSEFQTCTLRLGMRHHKNQEGVNFVLAR